jgi:hypothetical protein
MDIYTVEQLIKAAKKNGHPWGNEKNRKDRSEYVNGVYSCVVGQGLINLGVKDHFPYPTPDSNFYEAWKDVIRYNDYEATSFEDAYAYMVKKLTPFKGETIAVKD